MKRLALIAVLFCACIDWEAARSKFFNDGGSTGGGSAASGGGSAATGGGSAATGGGSVGVGGGGFNGVDGGSTIDGGMVCSRPAKFQWVYAGHLDAIGVTTKGLIGVGRIAGQPALVEFEPNSAVTVSIPFFTDGGGSGEINALAVSGDGHRMAAVGTATFADGGPTLFLVESTDGGPNRYTLFGDNSGSFANVPSIAFNPIDRSTLYLAANILAEGAGAPLTGVPGIFVCSVNLDTGSGPNGATSIVGSTCTVSDIAATEVSPTLVEVATVSSGSGSCAYAMPMGDPVIGARAIATFDGISVDAEAPLLALSGVGLSSTTDPALRDRLALWPDGGFAVTSSEPMGTANTGELFTTTGARSFNYSDGTLVFPGATALRDPDMLLGGMIVTDDAGSSGVVWHLTPTQTSAADAEIQRCSGGIVTSVAWLADGGIVAATALSDGGDLTLVQLL